VIKSDILLQLSHILQDSFEIDPSQITREALLREDLDLDSIDAVDLLLSLKKHTGKKIQPEIFRSVKTVGDVVDALYQVMNEKK
jgi:acyl carrier protein